MKTRNIVIGYAIADKAGVKVVTQLNYCLSTHRYTFVITSFKDGKVRSYAKSVDSGILDEHLTALARLPRAQRLGVRDISFDISINGQVEHYRVLPDRAIDGNLIIDAGSAGTIVWINVANNPILAMGAAVLSQTEVSFIADGDLSGGSAELSIEVCGHPIITVTFEWGSG